MSDTVLETFNDKKQVVRECTILIRCIFLDLGEDNPTLNYYHLHLFK